MWEFYLAGAEISFRYWKQCVLQIQLSKRQDAVPATRDYMFEAERASAAEEDAAMRRSSPARMPQSAGL
jgi:cyclopropane-fatty-acyl-phospholipid synthase